MLIYCISMSGKNILFVFLIFVFHLQFPCVDYLPTILFRRRAFTQYAANELQSSTVFYSLMRLNISTTVLAESATVVLLQKTPNSYSLNVLRQSSGNPSTAEVVSSFTAWQQHCTNSDVRAAWQTIRKALMLVLNKVQIAYIVFELIFLQDSF